jgi:lipopolysaccharide transport system ATP-binding protein
MADLAIRAVNLSKRYRIVGTQPRHDTLRDHIAAGWSRLRRRGADAIPGDGSADRSQRSSEIFWALNDVSLTVKCGEVLGVIGRNGAGKSTLLKILSRITEPTSGRAELYGRVASLLEVGTGFHPELTGRENVYLNGSILGMTRKELTRKFEQIVDFAEIARFIDTPVKHYSSGMYVRLAFAVAAHLDPEILIVDEVLAVGDAMFQEKCLAAMQSTASSGKTVLFVSHNMASIQHLCSRAILLKEGKVAADGPSRHVVHSYLSELSSQHDTRSASVRDWPDRQSNGQARIVRFEVSDGSGQACTSIPIGGTVQFTIMAEFYEQIADPCFGVLVHNDSGQAILDVRSLHDGLRFGRAQGTIIACARISSIGLYPGDYLLSPWITDAAIETCLDWAKLCRRVHVYSAPGPHGDLRLDPSWGTYWIPSTWTARTSTVDDEAH